MFLSTDLKIREQYSPVDTVPNNTFVSSGKSSFSQVFSAAYKAGGGADYEKYFQLAADTYQVPVNLIKALAKAESDFDANAVSHCGAQGIMQLMPATARAMGVTNAFDPAQNIMGGTKYLRQMIDTFGGDVSKAIAAYNAGPGAIKEYGGVLPSQTNYVNKILGYAGISAFSGAAASGVFPGLTNSGEVMLAANDPLAQDDLASLIHQAYSFGSNCDQEYVRSLLQQIFLKNAQDQVEQELNENL